MRIKDPMPAEVLKRAQELALECERELRPDHVQTWDELPEYLRQHWIGKAQRPEFN